VEEGPHNGAGAGFSFVENSDSHIGFNKAANQDVAGTLSWWKGERRLQIAG
jgi:hypothetical protein